MVKPIILGLTEEIQVIGAQGTKEKVVARIDTGATSSSLDAHLSKRLGLNATSKTKVVKSASGIRRRPVVQVYVLLCGEAIAAEFTVADRSHMKYPVLLGHNILRKGHFLIDPQKGILEGNQDKGTLTP